jgi:multiple antibiotic resistance protein
MVGEAAKSVFLIVSALFPIVDPLGGSPIFLSFTNQYDSPARRTLSWRIAMNSFFLLVGSYLIGTHVLAFFGISLPVVQVGGGSIVIAAGWALLKSPQGEERTEVRRSVDPPDPLRSAFYPLTFPLTVGPGSISVAITLGANSPPHQGFSAIPFLSAIVGSAIVAASIFLCYASAERLARALGPTAMTVIIQLSAFLLVCIGVQILWHGASALLATVKVGSP